MCSPPSCPGSARKSRSSTEPGRKGHRRRHRRGPKLVDAVVRFASRAAIDGCPYPQRCQNRRKCFDLKPGPAGLSGPLATTALAERAAERAGWLRTLAAAARLRSAWSAPARFARSPDARSLRGATSLIFLRSCRSPTCRPKPRPVIKDSSHRSRRVISFGTILDRTFGKRLGPPRSRGAPRRVAGAISAADRSRVRRMARGSNTPFRRHAVRVERQSRKRGARSMAQPRRKNGVGKQQSGR